MVLPLWTQQPAGPLQPAQVPLQDLSIELTYLLDKGKGSGNGKWKLMGRQHCTSPAMFNLEVFEVSCFLRTFPSPLFSPLSCGKKLYGRILYSTLLHIATIVRKGRSISKSKCQTGLRWITWIMMYHAYLMSTGSGALSRGPPLSWEMLHLRGYIYSREA